ncbi:MAG: type II toxin-antitoxin system HicB family antitoxin [Acidobacteriota bacterium]|nr:type II toxin-antitoxin system HicB family antitoxin [Acidobacteriota bacterium]
MSTTQYQVLIRDGSGDLFVASVLGMADCVGEGRTREEALAKAKAALVDRLAHGEIVTIDVESVDINQTVSATNVWREEMGRFHDDPTFDEFVSAIQSERRDLDSEGPAS